MRRPLKYSLLSIFFSIAVCLHSQDHGFFNQVWLEQGLSQSSIISMVQDKRGFIWFATQDGLNRYDGRNIDHFNFKPFDKQSISGDDIYSVCLKDDTLYVLNDKGFDLIDLNTLSITNLKRKTEPESKVPFFKAWMLNNEFYMWSRSGLARTRINGDKSYSYDYCVFEDSLGKEIRPVVSSLCSDEKGNLFAASSKGIFCKKQGDKNFRLFFPLMPAKYFGDESEAFYTSVACKNGIVYAANSNQIIRIAGDFKKISVKFMNSYSAVTNLIIDKQNNIWAGTLNSGVFLLNEGGDGISTEKHFVNNNKNRFGLKSSEITCLYQNPVSKDDIVWIGSRDAGAFNYSYSKNSFSIPTSFVENADLNFFGVVKDHDGIIWAGVTSGILKIDAQNKKSQLIDLGYLLKRTNRPVEAICADRENNIWTAFGNAIYVIDKEKNILIPKATELVDERPNNVSRIIELGFDSLMLCTSRGLVIFNKANGTSSLVKFEKNNNEPIENAGTFFEDSRKNWWIGTVNGLWCVRKSDGSIFNLKHDNKNPGSILSNRVMDIKETKSGDILVATTKGLSIIKNFGAEIKNIYSAKGLPNNFIYGLLRDDSGNFWMSTNFGIAVFNPASMEFKSYVASDGICINEFNSGGFFKAADGEMIFGGLGGLVSINPKNQILNKSVSDIVLRNVRIEDYKEAFDPEKKLSLSFGQNDLYFEFSVPDYSGEKNINLFYRFKNKDTSWIRVNPSQILSLSFIDLAPGTYKLEVVAVNKEGARSLPYTFSFSIGDPFWSTWWFYFIIVLITGVITWAIYRVRLKRKIAYIHQIEEIRKDENEKVRKAAALDLHDEFGNGLTRISMLIEMVRIQISKDNREAHSLLDLVTQNSARLYQGTKDFIWSINPGKDNLYEIAIRVKDFADEIFHGTSTTFEMQGLKEELKQIRQTPTAGRNIAMIFKESLSNVVKHARASHVKFIVRNNAENIYLILSDNGSGFEMKDNKNSFGITNIQQRANRLSAEININSELNKGTEIVLVISMNGKHKNVQERQMASAE